MIICFRNYLSIIFLLIICFISNATPRDSVNVYLSKLDIVVKQKVDFETNKNKKIKNLKTELQKTSPKNIEALSRLYSTLFDEYKSYCFDSAFVYAKKLSLLAKLENRQDFDFSAKMMFAYATNSAGLFMESMSYLDSVDSLNISSVQKEILYSSYSKLYLDMALAIRNSEYEQIYLDKSIKYSKAIIAQNEDPTGLQARLQKANIYRCLKDYKQAIRELSEIIQTKQLDERSRALCMGGIGTFYLALGDTINGVKYLTESTINDIKMVIKESPALAELANIAYKYGFIERAYTYVTISMNDAVFYNARHRKIETSEILPIIEGHRFEDQEKEKRRLAIVVVFVLLLSISLIVAVIFILRQIKQLRLSKRLIEQKKEELNISHKKLIEANKEKDRYIGYFFRINSSYMDEIEKFKLLVSRKLAGRQYGELAQLLKQDGLKQNKEAKYATFDRIFLKLFPNFVVSFNNLFPKENQIVLPDPHVLSPELRIFALIRLGVTGNEEIAKFLHYSVNTINTYKTKVKKRSLFPNAEFEKRIMEIESFVSEEDA